MTVLDWIASAIAGALALVAIYDLTQKRHAVLRNFPIVGHVRYLLEAIGPELGSTSSRATTRSARSRATSGAGLFVGEAREQLLRLRHRQRHRAPGLRARAPQRVPDPHAAHRRGRLRSRVQARLRAHPRRLSRPQARVPAGVDRQHVGDELRLAVAGGGRIDQPRRRAVRGAAEHGRRRHLRFSSQGR